MTSRPRINMPKGPARKRSPDMMKAGKMKFKEDRPFATPDAAERKLLELANAREADHAARLSVGVINKQFRDAGGSYEDSDVPLFLSDHDEEREPLDTGKVWYRAAISSRNLKT